MYVKGLRGFDAHVFSGADTEGVLNPVFSPDGRSLAFFSQTDSAMKRIAIPVGAPATICPGIINPFGMRWDRKRPGVRSRALGVVRCAANGGKPERLISVAKEELAQSPQILPGGEWVLFTLARTPAAPTAGIRPALSRTRSDPASGAR